MRIVLQPTRALMEHQVNWWQSGRSAIRTLAQIADELRQFHVVVIHVRAGISTENKKGGHTARLAENLDYFRAFRCAESISKRPGAPPLLDQRLAVSALDDDEARPRWQRGAEKPVRWLVMSDSTWLKQRVREKYGQSGRVVMVDINTQHISKLHQGASRVEAIYSTFTEWYLISLGDEAVFNRIPRNKKALQALPPQRRLYKGRLSGFAKSAWAYGLHSTYFDAWDCKKRELPFDGAWGGSCTGNATINWSRDA